MQRLVDEIILVSEDEIRATLKFLLMRLKILTEPSGAVSAAPALFKKLPPGWTGRRGALRRQRGLRTAGRTLGHVYLLGRRETFGQFNISSPGIGQERDLEIGIRNLPHWHIELDSLRLQLLANASRFFTSNPM